MKHMEDRDTVESWSDLLVLVGTLPKEQQIKFLQNIANAIVDLHYADLSASREDPANKQMVITKKRGAILAVVQALSVLDHAVPSTANNAPSAFMQSAYEIIVQHLGVSLDVRIQKEKHESPAEGRPAPIAYTLQEIQRRLNNLLKP